MEDTDSGTVRLVESLESERYESEPRRHSWSTRAKFITASLGLGAVFVAMRFAKANPPLTSVSVVGEVRLEELSISPCGAYGRNHQDPIDAAMVGDFTSQDAMARNGWWFEAGDLTNAFKAPLNSPAGHQHDVLDGAYYGWASPGDLAVNLKLRGSGIVKVTFGNLNREGKAVARLDGFDFARASGIGGPDEDDWDIEANISFADQAVLTFQEEEVGILCIEKVQFICDDVTGTTTGAPPVWSYTTKDYAAMTDEERAADNALRMVPVPEAPQFVLKPEGEMEDEEPVA